MRFYPAALPLSTSTLNRVAALIRAHRRTIGSYWRVLDPGTQALLTLVYLRKGERFADLAAGFGISAATAWRRTRETIALLAARAPRIRDALRHAKRTGAAFVILDGTLVRIDRNTIDRPCYSGKHKRHGMNLQAIADARGNLLWIWGAIRGSIHDTKAARIWLLPRLLSEHGLFALGDKGYGGQFAGQLTNIDSTIVGIAKSGQGEVAKALRDLGDAITAEPALGTAARQDLLDNVADLAETVKAPPAERRRGRFRAALDAIKASAETGTTVAKAVESAEPVLRQFLS